MYPQREGGFGTMRAINAHVRPQSKNGLKRDRAKLFTSFDLSPRADHFGVLGCQNRMSKWPSIELCPFKVGVK